MVFLIQIKEKKMKKNFLMVAALLIAAMLMVVSCTQEVAPKNELVEAKLNVAYGRDLSVIGDTKQDGVVLTYKMSPAWNATGSERIYGGTKNSAGTYEFISLPANGSLGYVTPGLWNIEVKASGHDVISAGNGQSKNIFSGTASVYFNETTKEATVFLAPISTANNSVTFSFLMQDLSGDMNNDYLLTYKIYNGNNNSSPFRSGELEGSAETGSNNVKRYTETATINPLPGGFYRVNVSIYRKGTSSAENELVGGTTKGFLVSDEASVTIGGNIEPSDYESVSIDAYYVDVNTAFKTGNVMNGETDTGKDYGVSVNDTTNGGAKVTMGINDTTSHNSTITGTYTKTYLWTAVSDGETMINDTNVNEIEFEFNSPGYKNISCTTVYSITGTSTGGTSDTYYFADTISTQIYVDPTNFKVKTDTSSTT